MILRHSSNVRYSLEVFPAMIRPFNNFLPYLTTIVLGVALQGCSDDDDDPSGPDNDLLVEAEVAPGHIHSFESDVTFTLKFTTVEGQPVQDFIEVRTEISPATTDQWTKQVPLLFNGTEYTGTTKFTANGSFDVRVLGQRPGESGLVELYRWPEPLSSVRPHFESGGYRVEFETDTGEYPEHGFPTTFLFLIMEDVPSPRPPVAGLKGVVIRCTQGSEFGVHEALESAPGTYTASHVFTTEGEATVQLEFTGSGAEPAIVQIPLDVF